MSPPLPPPLPLPEGTCLTPSEKKEILGPFRDSLENAHTLRVNVAVRVALGALPPEFMDNAVDHERRMYLQYIRMCLVCSEFSRD